MARDWFLSFASAINDEGDSIQAIMFAKLYLFLRDFIPGSLDGDRFSFIDGSSVISHLLCHAGEFAVSQHRLAKDAIAAFSELEA